MRATLDDLPNEILLQVVKDYTLLQKARVSVCSRTLRQRLSYIWKNGSIRKEIMHAACKSGDVDVIRCAIAHGSSKSFIQRDQSVRSDDTLTSKCMISTLYLTATYGRSEAFKYLLSAGADIRDGQDHNTHALRPIFDTPKGVRYLEFCFEHGSEELQKNLCGSPALGSLVTWIYLGLSAHTTEKILQRNELVVNRMMRVSSRAQYNPPEIGNTSHSPLGIAIRTCSMDVFDVLLRHGADIDGRHYSGWIKSFYPQKMIPVYYPTDFKTQPPIFDAMNFMIEHSDPWVLSHLVEKGARMNIWGKADNPLPTHLPVQEAIDRDYPMTPIWYFVVRHKDWKPELNALKIAKYMAKCGSSIDPFVCCKAGSHALHQRPCKFHRWFRRRMSVLRSNSEDERLQEVLDYLVTAETELSLCTDKVDCMHCQLWDQTRWLPAHRTGDPGCSREDRQHRICYSIAGPLCRCG